VAFLCVSGAWFAFKVLRIRVTGADAVAAPHAWRYFRLLYPLPARTAVWHAFCLLAPNPSLFIPSISATTVP